MGGSYLRSQGSYSNQHWPCRHVSVALQVLRFVLFLVLRGVDFCFVFRVLFMFCFQGFVFVLFSGLCFLFCSICGVMTVRSEMICFISWPNLFITAALSDLVCHLWSLRSRTLAWKICFMSCVLSIKVRVMKIVYFAHALAYRSVWAMNTPYDPSWGMLPERSGKLTILKGKSSRLSYKDVTISPFRTSSCRSKYDALLSFLLFSCVSSSSAHYQAN